MKMIVLVSILILLTGCAVRDCKLEPQINIQTKSKETQSNSDSESKDKDPMSILQSVKDNAQPSGQLECKF
jgi:flagellar basal body L-ring protein FlgH